MIRKRTIVAEIDNVMRRYGGEGRRRSVVSWYASSKITEYRLWRRLFLAAHRTTCRPRFPPLGDTFRSSRMSSGGPERIPVYRGKVAALSKRIDNRAVTRVPVTLHIHAQSCRAGVVPAALLLGHQNTGARARPRTRTYVSVLARRGQTRSGIQHAARLVPPHDQYRPTRYRCHIIGTYFLSFRRRSNEHCRSRARARV